MTVTTEDTASKAAALTTNFLIFYFATDNYDSLTTSISILYVCMFAYMYIFVGVCMSICAWYTTTITSDSLTNFVDQPFALRQRKLNNVANSISASVAVVYLVIARCCCFFFSLQQQAVHIGYKWPYQHINLNIEVYTSYTYIWYICVCVCVRALFVLFQFWWIDTTPRQTNRKRQ